MLVWSIAVYLVAAADDAPDGIGKRTLEKHLPDPAHRRISCADVDIAGTPDEVGDAFAGESNSRIEQQQFKKTALFWSQLPLPERLATPWSGPYSRKTTFDRSEGRFVGRTSLPIEAQRVASTPDSSDERVGLSISQSLSQTCDTHCDSAPRIGAPTKRSVAAAAA